MITKEQAVAAKHRQEFEHVQLRNSDGTPKRCRVNGQCVTWVSRPNEFKLPVVYGLKDYFYITEHNAHQWKVKP